MLLSSDKIQPHKAQTFMSGTPIPSNTPNAVEYSGIIHFTYQHQAANIPA
jgi:hypothetical protein